MERHAGLLGQGWWELVDSQLTKPSEGFSSGAGSRHQVGCLKATPCARARLCHWGQAVPLRWPDSAPSVPRWLNTLGLLASQGIDVVVRHSFLDHGHNHLVDQNFNPLPVGLPGGVALVLASPHSFWGDSLLVACLNSA